VAPCNGMSGRRSLSHTDIIVSSSGSAVFRISLEGS